METILVILFDFTSNAQVTKRAIIGAYFSNFKLAGGG